jgi:hypothetical protein
MSDGPAPNDEAAVRSALELERLKLEIDKLKADVARSGRSQILDSLVRLTPLISVLIAVFGVTFSIYQYNAEQRKNRIAREEQSKKEASAAQREFMKPLLERQQQLYFEASSAAATIASSSNSDERRKAADAFWKLYWGPLIFVESKEVSAEMKKFGNCLDGTENCDAGALKNRSLSLASTMETSLLKTWNAKPEEFTQNQFIYR